MSGEYKTYIVSFKRTPFDITRQMKVMTDKDTQVRECVQVCEGERVIIQSIQVEDKQVSVR